MENPQIRKRTVKLHTLKVDGKKDDLQTLSFTVISDADKKQLQITSTYISRFQVFTTVKMRAFVLL